MIDTSSVLHRLLGAVLLTLIAAGLIEHHYDPAYARSRARIGGETLATLEADTLDAAGLETLARRIAEEVKAVRM